MKDLGNGVGMTYLSRKLEEDLLAASGMALGLKNLFAKDTAEFVSVKYSEEQDSVPTLENNGMTKKINDYAFFDKPEPTPRKKWEH